MHTTLLKIMKYGNNIELYELLTSENWLNSRFHANKSKQNVRSKAFVSVQ